MNQVWNIEHCGQVDDISMFWENSEFELVAKRLVDAGAVLANCKEANEMIRVAKSITSKEEKTIVDQCLVGRTILECKKCNHVHYIPSWCDVKDWKNNCDSCGK